MSATLGSLSCEKASVPLRLHVAYCVVPRWSGCMIKFQSIRYFQQCTKTRLPRGLFEYIDRGSADKFAFRAIAESLRQIRLNPRVLVDVSECSAKSRFFGISSAMPLVFTPSGADGLQSYDSEVALTKAARVQSDAHEWLDAYVGGAWPQLIPFFNIF